MLIGTAIRNCHGYDQGGYFKSQLYGAVLYVRRKEFTAVGLAEQHVHRWVQTDPASTVHDWSWPDSAGLCPAQHAQPLSRFYWCGHSAVLTQLMTGELELAHVRPAWNVLWLSSCLTELSVYMCLFSPLLVPKLNFHFKPKKLVLNFRIVRVLTVSIIILLIKEMACISFFCRSFIRVSMTIETRNVWEHCVSYKEVKNHCSFFFCMQSCK